MPDDILPSPGGLRVRPREDNDGAFPHLAPAGPNLFKAIFRFALAEKARDQSGLDSDYKTSDAAVRVVLDPTHYEGDRVSAQRGKTRLPYPRAAGSTTAPAVVEALKAIERFYAERRALDLESFQPDGDVADHGFADQTLEADLAFFGGDRSTEGSGQ